MKEMVQCPNCLHSEDLLEFFKKAGVRQIRDMEATLEVPEGVLVLKWPALMNDQSRADALQWMTLMRRQIERAVDTEPFFAHLIKAAEDASAGTCTRNTGVSREPHT